VGTEVLWTMLAHLAFTAPVLVMWLVAIFVGIRLLDSSRPAALCLIAAGLLELARNGASVVLVPLPGVLHSSGMLGSAGLSGFALLRGVVSLFLVVVAYTLLITAIFGFREAR